jgi:hypothetical protein
LDVVFGGRLAEVLGHYRAAIELYRSGDQQAALDQANHPIAELLPELHGFLAGDKSLAEPLGRAIGSAAAAVRERTATEFVAARFEEVNRAGKDALARTIGEVAASFPYNASLVAFLVASAVREYRRFQGDSSTDRTFSFHSAFGICRQARRVYGALEQHIDASVRSRINLALEALNNALPEIAVGNDSSNPEEIERESVTVAQELSAIGAIVEFEPLPEDLAAWTRRLLARSADAYWAGDRLRALDAVAAAHANHAGPLIESLRSAEPELAERLDHEIGSRLRAALHKEESAADYSEIVDEAIDLVDRAREIFAS